MSLSREDNLSNGPCSHIIHFLRPLMAAFQALVALGSMWKTEPESAGPAMSHLWSGRREGPKREKRSDLFERQPQTATATATATAQGISAMHQRAAGVHGRFIERYTNRWSFHVAPTLTRAAHADPCGAVGVK